MSIVVILTHASSACICSPPPRGEAPDTSSTLVGGQLAVALALDLGHAHFWMSKRSLNGRNFYHIVVYLYNFLKYHTVSFLNVYLRKDLLESTSCESDGNNDSLSQPDSRLKSESGSCWKVNKRSALCDEMELHNLLQKLSGHSLELHENSVPGDTDSLSSHTSGCCFFY